MICDRVDLAYNFESPYVPMAELTAWRLKFQFPGQKPDHMSRLVGQMLLEVAVGRQTLVSDGSLQRDMCRRDYRNKGGLVL